MPRATLSFKLPEEQEEFDLAVSGSKLSCNVNEFANWLRSEMKYKELTDVQHEIYEAVREKLWECLDNE